MYSSGTRQALVRHSSCTDNRYDIATESSHPPDEPVSSCGMTIVRGSATPAPATPVRRVILVVADGLRPDIIPLLELPHFGRLVRQGAATLRGRTVTPSVTAAAMGSLLTGVDPRVHGLRSSRFRIPRPTRAIHPLAAVLSAAGVPTAAWMARIPWTYRRLGAVLGSRLGFHSLSFAGTSAADIVSAAQPALADGREGLLVMHWPDADRAGHQFGWPSPAYLRAARLLDQCLGALETFIRFGRETLLIVVADHGGGGTKRCDHDTDHPLNRTIPIILAGGCVQTTTLLPDSSLIDIPATVLYALGVPIPSSYEGRPLQEAFFQSAQTPPQTSRPWNALVVAG